MGLRSFLHLFSRADRHGFTGARPYGSFISLNAKVAQKRTYGTSRETNELKRRQENEDIYNETMAGTLIDDRVNTLFGAGYTLYSEIDAARDVVQRELARMRFDTELPSAVREGYKQGYGIIEKVRQFDGRYILQSRSSKNIIPSFDEMGNIIGFRQIFSTEGRNTEIAVPKEDVILIVPRPAFETIGISMIERARKEIDYLENTNDASANAIWQNGYPSYEANVQQGSDMPPDIPHKLGENLRGRAPGDDFVTAMGLKLIEHGTAGIPHVGTYQEWAFRNLAGKMECPASKLGITENSESTANRHYEDYYKRIAAEQTVLASTVQEEMINDILTFYGFHKDAVSFEFDNPDPNDLQKRAEAVVKLIQANPMDPEYIITREQAGELILGKKFMSKRTEMVDTEVLAAIRAAADRAAGGVT